MLLCGLGGLLARLGSCAAAAVVAALLGREMARLRGHDAQVTNESAASGHVTAVLTCGWLQDLVNTAAMAAAVHSLRLEAGDPGTLWLAVLCLSPAQLIRSDNAIDIQYSNT